MKTLVSILLCVFLLCGCTQAAPAVSTEVPTVPTIAPTATAGTTLPPETTASTEATEPVDPLVHLVEEMSVEELVGQLFLARCPAENALEDILTYHLGGYILFGRNFENQTPESITTIISGYQTAAEIPMLIAVDEEGGTVTRVSSRSAFRDSAFPSPRTIYAQGGLELLSQTEAEKSQLLRQLGINVNMAPVCDITTDPNAFMYRRSLGLPPAETGEAIAVMVRTMSDAGVGSVLKHFPGYGNNTDTHTGIAVDNRSLDDFTNCDFIPFQSGIDAGCGAILVSHTVVTCLDPEHPASLSPAVIDYLRQEMDFDGVVITDDLSMQAITDAYGTEEAAVQAVLAGADLLCSTNYRQQYQAVLQAVEEGRISPENLRGSVLRIIRWKQNLGLLG